MLRGHICRQLLPLLDTTVLAFENGCYAQQVRGAKAAAKKKTTPTGKKGQQKPAKKQKQKLESKPFDEKDPLNQKVIAMLIPPGAAEPKQRTGMQQAEVVARAKEYSRKKMQEHAQWQQDLGMKLKLKQAALQALPPELRAAAEKEDLTPFPLTRHFLYDSPPESYRD